MEEKEPSKTTIYAVYAVMLLILALAIYTATYFFPWIFKIIVDFVNALMQFVFENDTVEKEVLIIEIKKFK